MKEKQFQLAMVIVMMLLHPMSERGSSWRTLPLMMFAPFASAISLYPAALLVVTGTAVSFFL